MNSKEFMTKTIFLDRENGVAGKDAYVIALDVGYSAVKVMSPNIIAMFPSYAVPAGQEGTAGLLDDNFIQYENMDTHEKWYVGKMASDLLSDDDTSVSESSLYGRDRYNDPMFRVIAEAGLGIAFMNAKPEEYQSKSIYVETGLPPRYITGGTQDKKALVSVLSGRHNFSLQIGQRPKLYFDFTILPQKVSVMPQPMGTLFSVSVDRNGNMVPEASDYLKRNVLIFDGGFGTLDIYPIKAHVIQRSETYTNLGMRRVLAETAQEIREKYNKEISVPAMQKYLERGSFRTFDAMTISTKDEPIWDILEENNKKVCEEAVAKLLHASRVFEYDYLIVTGGTGMAWYDLICHQLKDMTTLKIINGASTDDIPGAFANVRGYYMYRLLQLKSAGK